MKTTVCFLVIVAALTDFLPAQSVKMQPADYKPTDMTNGPMISYEDPLGRFNPGQQARTEEPAVKLANKPLPASLDLFSGQAVILRLEWKRERAGVALEKAIAITPGDDFSYSAPVVLRTSSEEEAAGITLRGFKYRDVTPLKDHHVDQNWQLNPVIFPILERATLPAQPSSRDEPKGDIKVGPIFFKVHALSAAVLASDNVTHSKQTPLPTEIMDLARAARGQFERANFPEAEQIYDQALALAPDNLYLLSNKGAALFHERKYELAEKAFKQALAVAPEDAFSHCLLGVVHYRQEKFDEAINELTKTLAINPKNGAAHLYLSLVAIQKGWLEAAHKELAVAIALGPNNGDNNPREPATGGTLDDFVTAQEQSRLKIPTGQDEPVPPADARTIK